MLGYLKYGLPLPPEMLGHRPMTKSLAHQIFDLIEAHQLRGEPLTLSAVEAVVAGHERPGLTLPRVRTEADVREALREVAVPGPSAKARAAAMRVIAEYRAAWTSANLPQPSRPWWQGEDGKEYPVGTQRMVSLRDFARDGMQIGSKWQLMEIYASTSRQLLERIS